MGDESTRFPTFWTEDGTKRATYTLTRAPGTKPGNFTLMERFLYTDPLTPNEGIVVPGQVFGILQLAPRARRAVDKDPSPTPVNAPPTIERFQ